MPDLPDWLEGLINEWVEHQNKKPDAPDDYLANVDHLRIQADHWESQNHAMRTVIAYQLAERALNERLKDA